MATDKQSQGSTSSESDVVMEAQPTTSSSSVATPTTDEPSEMKPPATTPDARVAIETAPNNAAGAQDHESDGGKKFKPKSIFSVENTRNSENDFLSPLFTNWPCIVTTVLGCYPPAPSADRATLPQQGHQGIGQPGNPLQDWPSQSKGLSSVQSIDSFTSHFVLNCDETCIENFTSTIVEKINSCLAESNQCSVDILDLSVHDVNMRLVDDRVIPILVGKRFLDSVIRVLGMEHSRVKNTFVEMQQLRSRAGEGEGSGGGRRNGGAREGGGRGLRSEIESGRNSSAVPQDIVRVTK